MPRVIFRRFGTLAAFWGAISLSLLLPLAVARAHALGSTGLFYPTTRFLSIYGTALGGLCVLVAWVTLSLAGSSASEPTRADRFGRALGLAWIFGGILNMIHLGIFYWQG